MHSPLFENLKHSGRPLLYIADALGIATILAGWFGYLPVVFTAFATFWASCYYLAMFYDSQLRRDICTHFRHLFDTRAVKGLRTIARRTAREKVQDARTEARALLDKEEKTY